MKTLALSAFLMTSSAFAWGPTGHRIVAEVAEKFVETSNLVKIQTLLKGENMARVANWPDEIRSEPATYAHTFPWHHTEWPDLAHEHVEDGQGGKLLTAIKENLSILANKEEPADKRAVALKFVIHLVGDLHQPLHVGNGLDQGSNNCKVTFHGKPTSLHAVWDEEMINFTQLSYTEFSKFITQGRTVKQVTEWRKGTLVDWARESRQAQEVAYPASCSEQPKLGYEYSFKHLPTVEQRLYQAGLRLGLLLNQALK
jgi:S1/P1 Nuclease